MPSPARKSRLAGVGLLALVLLTAVGLWKTSGGGPNLVSSSLEPSGIMGTECHLSAVVASGDQARVGQALAQAEAELRFVEALMSSWLEDSEISRLNRARAGETVDLSAETFQLLAAARRLTGESAGAFDITCRPLVELWRQAGETGHLPTPAAITHARSLVGWDRFELVDSRAIKRADRARVDPGGIAKGYGIDRAVQALEDAALAGGMVDVGGDLRVFGRNIDGGSWRVQLRSPIDQSHWAEILIDEGAVCTSGHYARKTVIEGRSYSHIVDPTTGHPVGGTLSVTVLAPSAMVADAWATALSVLGASGLGKIPTEDGIEALVIFGDEQAPQARQTLGFPLGETRGAFPDSVSTISRGS